MQKINPFDIMKKLASDNDKGFQLAPLSNIISANQQGARCTLTIGISPECFRDYMQKKIGHGGLILIYRDAYRRAEWQLANQSSQSNLWPEDPGYKNFIIQRQQICQK
jgi:hypothetical protein